MTQTEAEFANNPISLRQRYKNIENEPLISKEESLILSIYCTKEEYLEYQRQAKRDRGLKISNRDNYYQF